MGKHAGKPSAKRNQTFCLFMYSTLFVALISACQSQDSKPSSPIAIASKTFTKPTNRSEWRHLLGWNEDCEQSFSSTQAGNYSGIESYTLGDADELVIVICAVGSYQPSFLVYRLKNQHSDALDLETYITTDSYALQRSQDKELWGKAVFLPKTKELVILNASRQTKDCGTWAKYSFTNDTAKLQEFRVKLPCPDEMKEPINTDLPNPPEGWKLMKNR